MSRAPRVKSVNYADSEARPVLGPAGNKARSVELRKPVEKPVKNNKIDKPPETDESNGKKCQTADPLRLPVAASRKCGTAPSILRQRSVLSLNGSCSSDASSDSSHSRASTGRLSRRSVTPTTARRKQCSPRVDKVESFSLSHVADDGSMSKKRCAWVTPNTDPLSSAFHDEEWGVPVHDDKRLFEILSLCTALAELSWPAILSKRHTFREVFQSFDPIAVSKLNEKKIAPPGSLASSLLSEVKLRGIIENARQTCKIIDEVGSFDKYIWSFVNNKPIVCNFRYPRQVPTKTSKAEAISKDLIRRGFRGVGPTVVYAFMQVAGITNDHLIGCFRFHECIAAAASDGMDKDDDSLVAKIEVKQLENETEMDIVRAIDDFNLST